MTLLVLVKGIKTQNRRLDSEAISNDSRPRFVPHIGAAGEYDCACARGAGFDDDFVDLVFAYARYFVERVNNEYRLIRGGGMRKQAFLFSGGRRGFSPKIPHVRFCCPAGPRPP